ncbi:MAG: flagellar basal-body rod protein FlgF [Deltaproteobacteria bacterium]|nr:flagellar basal-body rod protein FlgF [Deltaproteobacteria bacterium]
MSNGIYIALSGAIAQGNAIEVVANNVANVETTGFRGARVSFSQALVSAQAAAPGGPPDDTAFVGLGQVVDVTQRPGTIVQTENPLDLALVGDGFFAVDTPRGPRYTRAGNFRLSENGDIADAAGNPARTSGGGHITIPEGTKSIQVSSDGTVLADGEELGTLELVRFAKDALQREGATLYAAIPGATPMESQVEVLSGALESSNVNGTRGVIDMIKINRTYDSLLKMIETYRELDSRTARELGGK